MCVFVCWCALSCVHVNERQKTRTNKAKNLNSIVASLFYPDAITPQHSGMGRELFQYLAEIQNKKAGAENTSSYGKVHKILGFRLDTS